MTHAAPGVPTERQAFRALTGAFLRRFFDNEITGGTADLKSSFFYLIGFLAGPLALMPMGFMYRYEAIAIRLGPEALRNLARPDKAMVFTLGMTAAGLIAAVVWSSLMLERRDGLILGALPVRGRTVLWAKLGAVAAYVFGISAAMHAVSSALFGLVLSESAVNAREVLLGPVAHFAGAVGACVFVFLCVTAAQGVTLALGGPAWFRRLSPVLQIALVATVIVSFTRINTIAQGVAHFNRWPVAGTPEPWVLWTPPAWFLGLDEWILGGADRVYTTLALRAIGAFAIVSAITLASYAVVYHRVMVRVVETPEGGGGLPVASAVMAWVTRLLSTRPVRRASAQFFFTSIARVERLRFVVAVTMGLVCAWIAPALFVLRAAGGGSPRTTFALSYATLLLVLMGMRIAISLPADLRAAWIVPAIGAPPKALRSGLWRALYVSAVVPVAFAFAAFHVWLWGPRLAVQHAAVMLTLGVLLVEVALWHFDDLPSSRPWRPENANLRFSWPAYLLGFTTITGTVSQIEWIAGGSLTATLSLAATFVMMTIAVRVGHRRPYPPISYEIETYVEPAQLLKLN